jgi:signal transduction histidine kinase
MRATSHRVPRPFAGAIPGAAVPAELVSNAAISAGPVLAGKDAGSGGSPAGIPVTGADATGADPVGAAAPGLAAPGVAVAAEAGGAVAAEEVPAGAAMATVLAVAARTAWTIRCIALGYIVIQVAIWHSFFAARPERLAGPAVAVLVAAAVAARLRWSQPGWRLATLDTAAAAALALGAWWCVPPAMQGDTSSWLYIAVVSQLIVPAWFAPAAALLPLTLVSAGAFWIGAARAAPARLGATSPAAAAANVVAIAAVAWCALWLLRRRARAADAALARADAESRADYVELTLSTERREHERLLHDTVLNTLTALGRDGARPGGAGHGAAGPGGPGHGGAGPGGPGQADDLDQAAAAARCQHDITLIEHALGAAHDAAGPAGGGLLIAVEAVAAEMRARGLTVHVAVGSGEVPGLAGPVAEIPDAVATALAFAVREALANVARHAGTAEAWVEMSAVTGAGRDGVEVTVRDRGAGFDLAHVDPARLGLRRSIVERVGDWGGQAAVHSAPGEGTVVTLRWMAAPAPAADEFPGARPC